MRFVLPHATAPSGGHAYNAAVIEHWPGAEPEVVRLTANWPDGDPHSVGELEAALDAPTVLVDGLVGAAHPDLIEAAVGHGRHIALLIHLPLADEGGQPEATRARWTDLEGRSVRAASQVIATSRTAASDLEDRYGRSVTAVPPGATRGPISPGNDVPHLVQIGAIGPRKNQLTTAHALQDSAALAWRASFVGPVADARYAAQLDAALPDRAVRLPSMTPAQISELLRTADLLLHPATAETWGMVVTEALAHGVPALVGDGTGAVEALGSATQPDGDLPGAIVEAGDWGTTLRSWLTDPQLRAAWRSVAAQARQGLRTWPQAAAELRDLVAPGQMAEAISGERIAADWLGLRRGADWAARSHATPLVRRCAQHLAGGGTVIDVGTGTGSNHAYLAPQFPGSRWILLDHDAELLRHIDAPGARLVEGGIESLPQLMGRVEGTCVLTCSALLDLLSRDQLTLLVDVIAEHGAFGLFAMSVDGTAGLTPGHPDDAVVLDAFNRHQRRRERPGPDAAEFLATLARRRGLVVDAVATPWRLSASSLTERLLDERGAAAREQAPELRERIDEWRRARLAEPELRIEIGHLDLLITPPDSRSA